MKLKDSIVELQSAVEQVVKAVLTDDLTQLESFVALKDVPASFGVGENSFDVVVFGDLNDFKNLNDKYGHEAGDLAIATVGGLLKKLVIEECCGRAFRRSGDEFVVLLSVKYLKKFKAKAKIFASCPFEFGNQKPKTAMSFGYAIAKGEIDFDKLLERAETACQIAKLKDGNCIKWTNKYEQGLHENLRSRCKDCGTKIKCEVPLQSLPQNKSLRFCPCCGEKLSK